MIDKKITVLLSQQTTRVKSVDFHPVKPIFIIGLHDGRIQAWDYNSNACIFEFLDTNKLEQGSIRSVCFHPHGDFFVSCGDDKLIRMWDYTKRKLLKIFKGHTDFIRSCDFHPTKPWIISASDDQTIKIWNFMTGKCLTTATGHSHYVMSAKFLDENTIISGSLDNSIRIWDCKNLFEKTNKFVPDVIVKQIVHGHDRGVNFIEIYFENNEILILSGGDDREVKIWDYRHELLERESVFAHQGCVSGSVLYNNFVCSVGEDGLFCIFDLKTKKSTKHFLDTRYWTIKCKNGFFVLGHDNGFEILEYSEPKLVSANKKGCFYYKNNFFYFSDLNTERKVCKAEGEIKSINSLENILLIRHNQGYEIYEKNKKIVQGSGQGIFLYEDLVIVEKKDKEIIIKDLDQNILRSFETCAGDLLFGNEKYFFVVNNNLLLRYTREGLVDSVNLGFPCENVYISELGKEYAFISKNKIALYDENMNLINQENEIVNIRGGFFYEDIFIYATSKHLKYLFSEQGVLISLDSVIYPFFYKDDLIFFISDEGIESMEVDITEINFKKQVIINGDMNIITDIIESGSLPGLSPLSFLIKKHKGDIALPYIKNIKQRFELCLSTGKFEECFKYCEEEQDHQMYEKLCQVAIENANFEISEKCLIFLQEWYELFILYICTNKKEKLKELIEICDEQTEKIIRLYLEDTKYFYLQYNNEKSKIDTKKLNKKGKNDTKKLNDSNNQEKLVGGKEKIRFKELNEHLEKMNIQDYNKDLLENIKYEKVDINSSLEKAYGLVTLGNFIEALEIFRNCLYTLATQESSEDLRFNLGEYISGLNTQLYRKKEEDPRKQIIFAKYFASLNLKPEHKKLAQQEYVSVCLKNGNYKEAKKQALVFSEENKPKIIRKALKLEDPEDMFDIPEGIFCYDILDFFSEGKVCSFCYVRSQEGEICSLCEIGYLTQ
ncbi:coatomer subunit beta [Vairimorpha necatrix]|uniref:Coatomer subunit beta n=1 Tax=Vairimorpha necatrix TaxID=6039 RepID=A0AAX4J9T8_9MICR